MTQCFAQLWWVGGQYWWIFMKIRFFKFRRYDIDKLIKKIATWDLPESVPGALYYRTYKLTYLHYAAYVPALLHISPGRPEGHTRCPKSTGPPAGGRYGFGNRCLYPAIKVKLRYLHIDNKFKFRTGNKKKPIGRYPRTYAVGRIEKSQFWKFKKPTCFLCYPSLGH